MFHTRGIKLSLLSLNYSQKAEHNGCKQTLEVELVEPPSLAQIGANLDTTTTLRSEKKNKAFAKLQRLVYSSSNYKSENNNTTH